MSIEAMKQALAALKIAQNNLAPSREDAEDFGDDVIWGLYNKAITALRQAIEQAEMIEKSTKAWADTPDHFRDATKKVVPSNYSNSHQPVAWREIMGKWKTHYYDYNEDGRGEPLYTAPITRQENRQVAKNATTGNQEVAKSATTDWEAVAADQAMTIAMLKLEQKREWVGLTDHELQVLDFNDPERGKLARAVEAKLKEKNG
jgi:hypothetical protein